jgi:hypothetical protein
MLSSSETRRHARLDDAQLGLLCQPGLSDPAALDQVGDIFHFHRRHFIYSVGSLCRIWSPTGLNNFQHSTYGDANSKYGSFDSHPSAIAFAPPDWPRHWEAEKPLKLS